MSPLLALWIILCTCGPAQVNHSGAASLVSHVVTPLRGSVFKPIYTASRDGKLRAASKWYVYNYDKYGRELQSGFYGKSLPSNLNTIVPAEVLLETAYGTQASDWDKVASVKTKVLGSTNSFLTTTNTYTSCGLLREQRGNNHLLLSPPTHGELTTWGARPIATSN